MVKLFDSGARNVRRYLLPIPVRKKDSTSCEYFPKFFVSSLGRWNLEFISVQGNPLNRYYFFMSSDNYKTVSLSLYSATLLTISQAAIGCGIGILLADKISENKRNSAAIAMLALATATTVPTVVGILADLINGPQSRLGVRRRLRSIREDSGLHQQEEVL